MHQMQKLLLLLEGVFVVWHAWTSSPWMKGPMMQRLQSINVDWDIYKMIEAERRGFDEPHHVALRRLLKLSALPTPSKPQPAQGRAWIEDGVEIPHGSKARMEYQRGKQVYEGLFLNGKLVVNGQSFDALSAAASALAKTKDGSKPSLNGWLYWKVLLPGETTWRSLREMRHSK